MKIHWIFRVVSLFNYQGACLSLFASDFVIISHRFQLVKHFFKKFFKFFWCVVVLSNSLLILPQLFLFVNYFFQSFLIFLNYWNCFKFCFIWNSFVILPQCLWFVNNFFNFFSKVFLLLNGDGGIWTLAPVARPTPLAGAPLQPLEYISKPENSLPRYWLFNCTRMSPRQCKIKFTKEKPFCQRFFSFFRN